MNNRIFSNMINGLSNINHTGILSAIERLGMNEGIIVPTPDGIIVAPCPENKDIDEYINELLEAQKTDNNKNTREPAPEAENNRPAENTCCKCCADECENCCDEEEYEEVTIEKVIYNNNTTIILFSDNTKTIAQCDEHDENNPTAGFAIALLKKLIGNKEFRTLIEQFVFPEYKKRAKNSTKPVTTETEASDEDNTPVEKETTAKKDKTDPNTETKTSAKKKPAPKKKSVKKTVSDKAKSESKK